MLQLNENIKALYIKCIQNNWDVHVQYISTTINPADMPSRMIDEVGPRLDNKMVQRITPNIDLMASKCDVRRVGTQDMRYISRYPEEHACHTDFFSFIPPANPEEYYYVFPNKAVQERTLLRLRAIFPKHHTIFIHIQYREHTIMQAALADPTGMIREPFSCKITPTTFSVPQQNTSGYMNKQIGLRLWAYLV